MVSEAVPGRIADNARGASLMLVSMAGFAGNDAFIKSVADVMPLSQAVFDKLLADQERLPDTAIKELRSIATRAHRLARGADDSQIAILAELSRKCAVDAVVEGLRLGEDSKAA